MKTNLKLKKKFILPQKNFSEKKITREEYQIVNDAELNAISEKIIEQNKKVYAELAK